jgi:arginase family enzyme
VAAFRWRPDRVRPTAKNATAVARVAAETAAGVARIVELGQTPIVVGGDCSITIGAPGWMVAFQPRLAAETPELPAGVPGTVGAVVSAAA